MTTTNPEAIARITPLSHLSQLQLSDLYAMAEAMQRAARLALHRGVITSRSRAKAEIAARGLCFLVRAEFDSRTLASLGEQA